MRSPATDSLRIGPCLITDPDSTYYGMEIDVHLCVPCAGIMLDWMCENYSYQPVCDPHGNPARPAELRRLVEKADEL